MQIFYIALTAVTVFLIVLFPEETFSDNNGQRIFDGYMHEHDHALGGILSNTRGAGLSYRYWPGKHGLQVSFLPINTDDLSFYNTGIAHLFMIRREKLASLYLSSSTSFVHYNGQNQLRLGLAPGVEFHFVDFVGVHTSFGYGLYDVMGNRDVNFSLEIGCFLYF